MIAFRVREYDWQEWTEVSFDGEDEDALALILGAALLRLDWTVLMSRDDEEFYTLGEDEEPEE